MILLSNASCVRSSFISYMSSSQSPFDSLSPLWTRGRACYCHCLATIRPSSKAGLAPSITTTKVRLHDYQLQAGIRHRRCTGCYLLQSRYRENSTYGKKNILNKERLFRKSNSSRLIFSFLFSVCF